MSKFQKIDFYQKQNINSYSLLPFRFTELDEKSHVVTNMAGEYLVLPKEVLPKFVKKQLTETDPEYIDLRAKHFLIDDKTTIAKDLLAIKLRTKYEHLANFTSLHIFVISLRCEHSCPYCQVSRQSDDNIKYDMSHDIASKSIDLALRSPSPLLKFEFQGGEPLLNFELIKYIVNETGKRNLKNKEIAYVIATNLALVNDEILEFGSKHKIFISTSLDGPEDLHNKNRPRPGKNSHQKAIQGINQCRAKLGREYVSALMTTTEASLGRPKEIIDEYLLRDFDGIFLRPLSPYGFAIKTKSYETYNMERWLQFYIEGIEYIIQLNKMGIPFQEYYATTILNKIFTSIDPGYVDLMSPAGIGIGAIVYNYDGVVYPSDESRMLAEMGETKFQLGNVLENTYEEIILNPALLDPIEESIALSVPMCDECAFESYCGADPVFHYGMYKDFIGRKPESEFCNRNMGIFKYLISKMESDKYVKNLFLNWTKVEC